LLLSFFIFTLNCCTYDSILETKAKELYLIKIPNQDYEFSVVYLPSNATIQSAIQTRKKFKDKVEILNTYERYNHVDTCTLINDKTFMLVVRDTVSILGNKPDTIMINIK
jgi:hypothetical protein